MKNFTRRALWFLAAATLLISDPSAQASESSDSSFAEMNRSFPQSCVHRFKDGAAVRVHYDETVLAKNGESVDFAREVLHAAVLAYETITRTEGFSTEGYTFAAADPLYAYDPDRTIDIYLGDPSQTAPTIGKKTFSFKDAPCFDTVHVDGNAYQAMILLPANYREFIGNWEKINPSPLGPRSPSSDLRGTLVHEMLHVIVFYYNRNLNKDDTGGETPEPGLRKHTDWYVEGLARYFETLVGARHDFFSQGFKQTLPDKIRFSRGGSNFFMRYPDQPFTELRYENALFWRFLHERYGMGMIERLSRELRGARPQDYRTELERATREPLNVLLGEFALAALVNDFGLAENASHLMEVAETRILYRNNNLYLRDGNDKEKFLGLQCETDWIGRWQDVRSSFGDLPIAGDSTEKSDVSAWATDFTRIDLGRTQGTLPELGVRHLDGASTIDVRIVIQRRGAAPVLRRHPGVRKGEMTWFDFPGIAREEAIDRVDVTSLHVLITNTDPRYPSDYRLELR